MKCENQRLRAEAGEMGINLAKFIVSSCNPEEVPGCVAMDAKAIIDKLGGK